MKIKKSLRLLGTFGCMKIPLAFSEFSAQRIANPRAILLCSKCPRTLVHGLSKHFDIIRNEALSYINRNGSPVLVHGTDVESALEILEKGKISPPKRDKRDCVVHPFENGYMFFVPRKKSFENHPLYKKIKRDLDKNQLEDRVRFYAESRQQITYLNNVLGYWPESLDPLDFMNGDASFRDLQAKGINTVKINKIGWKRLALETNKRKGVILGLNKKVLELPIEDGCDSPGEEAMIHLPNGLDRKYLQYIYPLGEIEENILHSFIQTIPS